MKKLFLITVTLAIIGGWFLLCPDCGWSSDNGTQWRQRLSADTENASDVDEEVRFGREVAARILGRYPLVENQPLQKYVNLVGRSLAQNANRPEIEFHFAVLRTDEINAYAAPGGYIFVTQGALDRMQDEAELASVLAHEISHVADKHAVKELGIKGADDSAVSGLARVIGGSTDAARAAFSQAVDKAMDILFKDGYRREDENQADHDAVLLCALSGYDPTGLTRYLGLLEKSKGKHTAVLDRTHPPLEERISLISSVIAQEGIVPADFNTYRDRFADVMTRTRN